MCKSVTTDMRIDDFMRHTTKNEAEFRELCTAHGCKCTRQRRAVYQFLKGNETHPTVNQVWEAVRKKIPTITRESVFRILSEFVEFGIAARMDKVFNARFDSNAADHGHAICIHCGKILDIPLPTLPVPGQIPGFAQLHTEYRLWGVCQECARRQEQAEAPPEA